MSSYGPSSAPRGAMSRRVLRGFNPTEFAALRLRRGLTVSEVARLADRGPLDGSRVGGRDTDSAGRFSCAGDGITGRPDRRRRDD